MDNHTNTIARVCLVAWSMLLAGQGHSACASGFKTFPGAVSGTLHMFITGNWASLESVVSDRGLFYLNSSYAWDRAKRYSLETDHSNSGSGSLIAFTEGSYWDDDVYHLDNRGLHAGNGRQLFRNFAKLISQSVPNSITDGLDLPNHWDGSGTGPSVRGKVLSDEYWIIHFTKEGSSWKISELQTAIH